MGRPGQNVKESHNKPYAATQLTYSGVKQYASKENSFMWSMLKTKSH